jgi:hypothetical protein
MRTSLNGDSHRRLTAETVSYRQVGSSSCQCEVIGGDSYQDLVGIEVEFHFVAFGCRDCLDHESVCADRDLLSIRQRDIPNRDNPVVELCLHRSHDARSGLSLRRRALGLAPTDEVGFGRCEWGESPRWRGTGRPPADNDTRASLAYLFRSRHPGSVGIDLADGLGLRCRCPERPWRSLVDGD